MQGGKTMTKGKVPGRGEKADSTADQKPELVPPDGGWGWVVVFAFALSNVIVVPILQSFGLLFRGRFETLGISGTDASVIINVNAAFGMILGLFSGFLLRSFGYRKITATGAIINSIGVILTSQADSFGYFLFTYGIISSIGFNMLSSGLGLAINTYFRERRGKAVGFGTTAMGLGPVFMPLVISKLMDTYGVMDTALILGGLSLHSFVGALLLQPVKWHLKPKKTSPEIGEEEEEDDDEIEKRKSIYSDNESTTITAGSSIDLDIDSQSVYGFETPLTEHRRFSNAKRRYSTSSFKRIVTHVDDTATRQSAPDLNWWASAASLDTVNLGSSFKIFDEKAYQPLKEVDEDENRQRKAKEKDDDSKTASTLGLSNIQINGVGLMAKNGDIHDGKDSTTVKEEDEDEPEEKEEKLTFWQRLGRGIVAFFDLGLLKDPIYVNLMIGMSLAICAELNFSLLTPFILNDRGFNTDHTAIIMSVIAGLDIVFRFLAPFFSDYYKIQARNMYIIALIMLISSRTALIFSESFIAVMVVAVALGVAKGVRTVYMTIVIPSYVPIERLPAASGIQMVTNGILLMAFGPLIGIIRDESGSYNLCIGFINLLTLATLSMWTIEIIIMRSRQKHQQTENDRD